jgi:excisionase family DNA binding protein
VPHTEPLLTTGEAADLFQVSDETVRRWAEDGRLPAITLPSGRLRFRRADVLAFLEPTDGAA